MAVHCSSYVILLAIEYFIDSKGERQNIKLLSTQNNYSPSFGLKKLVIFSISSDKKNSARAGSTKTRCRTKRRGGQGMAFDQGASRPQAPHNYREKHRSPTKSLAFEIKENTENVAEYRRKKLVSSLFFILIIFLFRAKSGGGGAKKWWGRGPTSPSPSAAPVIHGWFVYWVFGCEMSRLSKPIIRFRMASFLFFTFAGCVREL